MAEMYSGEPNQLIEVSPTPPAAVNILSSTHTAPVQITTSTPHGVNENEFVVVQGHLVNTTANGIWRAHVVSSTEITLIDSTLGGGAGGATGTCKSLAFPQYPIADDGDTFDSATFGVALEALGDRTALLWMDLGWDRTLYPGGTSTISSTAVETVASGGIVAVASGGLINVQSAGIIDVLFGGSVQVESGGFINIKSGSNIDIQSGGSIQFVTGGTISAPGGNYVTETAEWIWSGSSAVQAFRYHAVANSTPQTVTISNDYYEVPAVLSANTTLNISAGTRAGQVISINRRENLDAHSLTLHDNSGGSDAHSDITIPGGQAFFIDYLWNGNGWRPWRYSASTGIA
jgi:hypothetical protein